MALWNGIDHLSEQNFTEFCSEVCDRRLCQDRQELNEILRYVAYIKRLFTEYELTGQIRDRLLLNHIITLSNVFGPEHTCLILFFKVEKKHYPYLKTFLTFLHYMPTVVDGLEDPVFNHDITIDTLIHSRLSVI